MSAAPPATAADVDHVRWHDLECGGYVADLPLWRELAGTRPVRVRDLGAGTGRVALDLAAAGHRVEAVDADPVLLRALGERAAARGLGVDRVHADVRDAAAHGPGRPCEVVLAPMQTVQLLGGPDGRRAMLGHLGAGLAPGGLAALAVATGVEPFVPEDGAGAPPPDVADHDGAVYASRAVAVRPARGGGWDLERVREVVAADGTLRRTHDVTRLDACPLADLEADARAVGLLPAGRRTVAETGDHVGSVAVLLRRAADDGEASR